jgi:hypothetical protein
MYAMLPIANLPLGILLNAILLNVATSFRAWLFTTDGPNVLKHFKAVIYECS